jgi:hypothetical protein
MKKAIVSVIAALVVAVTALSAYAAIDTRHATRARGSRPDATSVRQASSGGYAFGAGVAELARNQGLDLASLKQLATSRGAHPASVWGTTSGTSTCAYLTGGTAAIGGCMHLGANLVVPRLGIVDGGTYVWGLAAPGVSGVQAHVGRETLTGSIAGGLFVLEIPDGSHGTASVDLVVTAGSSSTTISLPGIPAPPS